MEARLPALVPAFRSRALRLGTTPSEVLLALGLLVVALGDVNGATTRDPVLAALVTVPVVAALAWRRRAPAAVALALCLLDVGLSATTPGPWPPQLLLPAVLLGTYTAAAQTAGRRAAITGGMTLALLCVAHVLTPQGDPDDFLPIVLWAAPWTAGRLVRRQTLAAAAAATQAAAVLRRRDEELREARVRERDRIARELHDVVAHGVSLMVVQAGAERLRLGEQQPQTRAVLAEVETAGRVALADLRAMLGVLRNHEDDPAHARDPQPAWQDLPLLVDRVRGAGLPVELDLQVPEAPPGAVSLSVYRIVQEALTNVLKHAGPVPTTVRVHLDADAVHLDVVSRLPTHVPAQRPAGGRGLVGMHERAVLHGGTVAAGPEQDVWAVRAVLPLAAR